MEDYNNIPFKNAAISRLTKNTTLPERFNRQGARTAERSDKAQEKLAKYVNSPKAPNSTKEMYGQAKQYLGGYYDNKPLNKMTDVDYNDKKAQKFKSMADKAEIKGDKVSARAKKYSTKQKSTGLEYEPKVRKRHMKP